MAESLSPLDRDVLSIAGRTMHSRLLLGTSQYPSPAIVADAVRASGAEVVTVSLRREAARLREGQDFWRLIREIGVRVLPNTAGCHSVKEAVTTAEMAREIFATSWIKLEVIGEADTLQPDVFGLVEAARAGNVRRRLVDRREPFLRRLGDTCRGPGKQARQAGGKKCLRTDRCMTNSRAEPQGGRRR